MLNISQNQKNRAPLMTVPSFPSKSALRASSCKSVLNPLYVLECEYDFKNYSMYMCLKSDLLEQRIEKSPTCSNFEIFEHERQPNIKF